MGSRRKPEEPSRGPTQVRPEPGAAEIRVRVGGPTASAGNSPLSGRLLIEIAVHAAPQGAAVVQGTRRPWVEGVLAQEVHLLPGDGGKMGQGVVRHVLAFRPQGP